MSTNLLFGPELAARQPHPVPLFRLFDWASSDAAPEGNPRDFFALHSGGEFSADTGKDDLALAACCAPSGQLLSDAFESLCLELAKAPEFRSVEELLTRGTHLASPRERYQSFSTQAVGGFLTVARFWIPPSPTLLEGGWSEPVMTVIGAPTTTVDATPVARLAS